MFQTLEEVRSKVRASFAGQSPKVDIVEMVAGLSLGQTYHRTKTEVKTISLDQKGQVVEGEPLPVVLGRLGFTSLVKDHLFAGGTEGLRVISNPAVSAETKLAMLREVASALPPEKRQVILKTNSLEEPSLAVTDAIVPADAQVVSNWDLMEALMEAKGKTLPDDIQIQSAYIQPQGGRYLQFRLISQEAWTYRIGNEPYYGAMVIENNELGPSFRTMSALQKLACTNYAIGATLASHKEEWGGRGDFKNALAGGAGELNSAFDFMRDRHERMLGVEVAHPSEFLTMVLHSLGVRDQKTNKLAQDNLQGSSVDSVLQAVTYASHNLGGRSPMAREVRRLRIEGGVFDALGINTINQVDEGVDIDDLYMTDDLRLRDAISSYLEAQATAYEGPAQRALKEASEMVFDIQV